MKATTTAYTDTISLEICSLFLLISSDLALVNSVIDSSLILTDSLALLEISKSAKNLVLSILIDLMDLSLDVLEMTVMIFVLETFLLALLSDLDLTILLFDVLEITVMIFVLEMSLLALDVIEILVAILVPLILILVLSELVVNDLIN